MRQPREAFLCSNHIDDYAISVFIDGSGNVGFCNYCGSKSNVVVSLEELVEFINKGLGFFFDDAGNNMSFESAEGGYHGAPTFEFEELLEQAIGYDEIDENLRADILAAFDPLKVWCEEDPYGDRQDRALTYSWKDFKQKVKAQGYVPGQVSQIAIGSADPVFQILSDLGQMVNDLKLFREIPRGSIFFRCRHHKPSEPVTCAADMVSPPVQFAVMPNRMSPAGTSMFYCAFDKLTSHAETVQFSSAGMVYKIAVFRGKRDFRVLDLSMLPPVPSMFDEVKHRDFFPIVFLRDFIHDFSADVKRSGNPAVEYVPTQLVTEYFKEVYQFIFHDHVDGIVYPSSKNPGGNACVLFLDHPTSLKAMDMVSLDIL